MRQTEQGLSEATCASFQHLPPPNGALEPGRHVLGVCDEHPSVGLTNKKWGLTRGWLHSEHLWASRRGGPWPLTTSQHVLGLWLMRPL